MCFFTELWIRFERGSSLLIILRTTHRHTLKLITDNLQLVEIIKNKSKIDGSLISQGSTASTSDRKWINTLYLPYIARSDTYRELDNVVYKSDNTIMTESERLSLQAQLNNGNSTPPAGGRIDNNF